MHAPTSHSANVATAIATALLALAALIGCGGSTSTATLDVVKLERTIAGAILTGHHVYTLVSCPTHLPQQRGRRFTCTAKLTVGSYPVYVTEVDNSGHVSYHDNAPLSMLDTHRVEASIATAIHAQRGLLARVKCPSEVLQRRGLAFTCTASTGGGRHPFAVTEIDDNGHVRYVGR